MNSYKTASAVLDIDLAAVAENIRRLQRRVGPACCIAGMVKADAYGIGMAEVARIHLGLGTTRFFVATLDEAVCLRGVLGHGPRIAVLGGLFHGAGDVYAHHDLLPVLNALGDLERWTSGAPAILHIDTGMRRLGLDTRELQYLYDNPDLLRGVNIQAVISHFACADEPGHPLTAEQGRVFAAVSALFPHAEKSLSNSAGIFVSRDYDYDFVRPGMAVYGLNPTPGQVNPMVPVVGLRARVLQLRQASGGESVGYGATYVCPSGRRVATIGLGYADGFLRSLSGRGRVFWRGAVLPVIGRISMDLVTLDASAAPGLAAGDWVDVLGPDQDADGLAAQAGTIGYEILTGLGARYARVYHNKAFEQKPFRGKTKPMGEHAVDQKRGMGMGRDVLTFLLDVCSAIGATILGFFQACGRLCVFMGQAVAHVFLPPFFPRLVLRQLVDIGYFSLPVVGLTAIFTGMVLALQSYTGFARFNAESAIAGVVVLSMTRELAPVLAGLMVAGRVGASIAAEIGTMRVTEQIDALTTLSVNPFKYLIAPRIVAGLVTLPVLVLVGDIIGVFGGYVVSIYSLGFSPGRYLSQSWEILEVMDVVSGLVKAGAFGLIVALMGCYHGYNSQRGAQGVGAATTNAVVSASILILIFNFILTQIFFS